jgi:hypothetical protein
VHGELGVSELIFAGCGSTVHRGQVILIAPHGKILILEPGIYTTMYPQ